MLGSTLIKKVRACLHLTFHWNNFKPMIHSRRVFLDICIFKVEFSLKIYKI